MHRVTAITSVLALGACTPLAAPILGVDAMVPAEHHAELSAGVVAGTDKLTGVFAQGDFALSERVAFAGGFGTDTNLQGVLARGLFRVRLDGERSPVAAALIAGPSANLWTEVSNERTVVRALPGMQLGFATTLGRQGWRLGVGGLAVIHPSGGTQFTGAAQARTPLNDDLFLAGELAVTALPAPGNTDVYQGAMIRFGGRFRFKPKPVYKDDPEARRGWDSR